MNKTAIILFLMNVFSLFNARAQKTAYHQIKGIVLTADTKSPLQGASVFAENTTIGTTTDEQGKFILWLPEGGFDLAVSFTGYQTQSQHISNGNPADLQVTLSIKEKEMQEVSVVSTGEVKDGWEKYGTFFLEEFLGKTPNSKLCKITNKEALRFFYSKRKDRLKVLAKEPLNIDNNALGYRITYELDSFIYEYKTTNALYTGVPKFDTLIPETPTQSNSWRENREMAYYGSALHFMRSLYRHQLTDDGYEIQEVSNIDQKEQWKSMDSNEVYDRIKFQRTDSGLVIIQPHAGMLGILYTYEVPAPEYLAENPESPNKEFQLTRLSLTPQKPLYVESNGYYYPQQDVVINDYWEWTRMADMLPYNYDPEE